MKILITGSSKGIGYNIAKTLFKEGHSLFLHCNKNKNNLKGFLSSGLKNRVFAKDLSNQKGIELLFKETVKFFGFPDVLINNAGVAVPSFVDTTFLSIRFNFSETSVFKILFLFSFFSKLFFINVGLMS